MGNYRDLMEIAQSLIAFGIIFFALYTSHLLNTNSWANIVVSLLIGLLAVYTIARGAQKFKGVTTYIVNNENIIIPHAIGNTKIPLSQILTVNVGSLTSHSHTTHSHDSKGRTKTKTTIHYTDTAGNPVVIGAGILKCEAPYTSHRDGTCVLVGVKNKKRLIALTPNNPEEMKKVIDERIEHA